MMQLLSSIERTQLLSQHKLERDGRIRDKIKVILLTDDGWSVEQIAKALFIRPSTVKQMLFVSTLKQPIRSLILSQG